MISLGELRLATIGLAALLATLAASSTRAATLSCAQAAAVAETSARIPARLLLAIGVVETGRTDAAGARAPWPWSIQTGSVGRYFDSAEAAVAAVQSLLAHGVRSIDVGCFQINLFHHSGAFPDLASGFDPLTNATVAAHFLVSLHDEFGAWEPAVAAYHSRTQALGTPYRDMVLASWRGAAPPLPGKVAVVGIRVWGPAGEIGDTAAPLVAISPPPPGMWIRMPRTVLATR